MSCTCNLDIKRIINILIGPHQVDFGPACPKKIEFPKKKKKKKKKKSARDQMWSISATAVSVYNAAYYSNGVKGRI